MDKYRNMQLFCTVVDRGSFSKAAKALGVTPAIVGRHIAAMEESLGFVLLNRTTRSMHLTPGGKAYYEGAQTVLSQIEQLEDSLTTAHQNNPEGLIRLSAPDGMGPFLMRAIKEFRTEYTGVRFDLVLSNNKSNLIEEEIDLSIRFAFELQDSSYIATKLGESEFGLYAAPSYIEAHGMPSDYTDLKNHDCLHMGSSRDGDYWMLTVDGRSISHRQPWVAVISDTNTLLQATMDGSGIAMIPSVFAHSHVNSGNLTKIENVAEFPIINIYGMYPTRKQYLIVSLFLEYLKVNFDRIIG